MEVSFNFEGVPGGSSLRKRHHDCLGLEKSSTSLMDPKQFRQLGIWPLGSHSLLWSLHDPAR